ncbi:hypothetical protein Acr_05g0011900 [Actinidia rufa]|uniref:Uncharacterized protein n=1 Tax=Actinidia rufa TaxID=165716 RepID=A0A7J0EM54_9ERIC|nr:hypothetical protein Acr_05g0011900 [Actinidia rufa]
MGYQGSCGPMVIRCSAEVGPTSDAMNCRGKAIMIWTGFIGSDNKGRGGNMKTRVYGISYSRN